MITDSVHIEGLNDWSVYLSFEITLSLTYYCLALCNYIARPPITEPCVCLCCSHVLHEQSLKSINYQEEAEKKERQTVKCRCLTLFLWPISDLIYWFEILVKFLFLVCVQSQLKLPLCSVMFPQSESFWLWQTTSFSSLYNTDVLRHQWRWKSPVIIFPAFPAKETSDASLHEERCYIWKNL